MRLICKKDIHIFLQIQVLFLALAFLPVIVRGQTMGKFLSIVTTCLVGSSSRTIFDKTDWVDGLRDGPSWTRRTRMDSVVPYLCNFFCCSPHYPRRQVGRTVIGTTVRRGSSFLNTSTLKSGYWDRLSELHDGTAGRTVTSCITSLLKLTLWTLWRVCRTDRRRYDGPSQAA